jgi:hypothetical protein
MARNELSERVAALEDTVASLQGLRDQVASMKVDIEARFDGVDARLEQLQRDLHEGDQETRRFMRILHEDVIARLAALSESRPPDSPPRG